MRTIPRHRIDGLTDGVFAVAMTILVLEIKLPPHAAYATAAELIRALSALGHEVFVYAISFFVLAVFWRGSASARLAESDIPQAFIARWIVYLFFITCIPMTTSVVGNHGHLAPAIWLYAANMILCSVAGWAMGMAAGGYSDAERRGMHVRIGVLALSAVLSVLISFVSPSYATLAYLLNIAGPPLSAWLEKRSATGGETD